MEAARSLNQKLHGYERHLVPQLHENLHPYLSPKKEKKNGVYRSFDGILVSNIKNRLLDTNTPNPMKTEGLLILNEKASTQEMKMQMIEEDMLKICIDLLQDEDMELSYEALRLLGSLCSLKAGRDKLVPNFNTKIMNLLVKKDPKFMEATSWMLSRIASARDGVDYLISNNFVFITATAIQANLANTSFTDRMLLVLVEMLQIDEGIHAFCSTGCFSEFLNVIKSYNQRSTEESPYPLSVVKRVVEVMSCITMNMTGRELFIQSYGTQLLGPLLEEDDSTMINNCLRTLMFASLDREGKRQLLAFNNGSMLISVIKLLNKYFEIRDNSCEVLINAAENYEALVFITEHMLQNSTELVRIFEYPCIRPLCTLLKDLTSSDYTSDPDNWLKISQIVDVLLKMAERDRMKTFSFIVHNTLNMIKYLLRCVLLDAGLVRDRLLELIMSLSSFNNRQFILLKEEHQHILRGETYIDVQTYGDIVKANSAFSQLLN